MTTTKPQYKVFLWGWCSDCGAHIVCPKCGNNTCNASFGNSDGTKPWEGNMDHGCEFCNLAYQYAHLCYANDLQPKTKRQVTTLNKKIIKQETV